ncbi:tRNA uridine-5-carboxymethylaminomethyl(34) synthesis GTPase MnmE [Pseudooceanicola sp.]|uniref:tRNA uridine-5-carboxymethylaminomethyl(34) synthesis GTPase MnmE n=1 Tax=Pseudooceanicola sp. TaxID=1914328 RepID=UPI00261CE86F|nr:tRNA uridine-5-carboxymethylaminomethyl(34) synthesis GTPase MnmE [Pseudooceanicola sp.]MDF1854953.1 tRNA uridine-5-carboxymethylaminomethyl(34) synthesis GTPase MnmE [Pseudooceanicola sp.]
MDTIFALATAPGAAGVAVVRVSGDLAWEAGQALAGEMPAPRRAGLRTLRAPDGSTLDQSLILGFRGGNSFTGEDVVEFHLHGSTAVVGAVLAVLGGIDGLRPAEAGEFTRRAMENGKLDLAQVEGLADLIDAETEAQRRQAMRVLEGRLGDLAATWRGNLIRAAALVETGIDFVDEDVPIDVMPEVAVLLSEVLDDVRGECAGVGMAERVRNGFEVAILGAPNVGKSTLLNALAGRDAAITSEVAGTTRDVIEVRMDLGGLAVTILDTAGLRETVDVVESIGIERARRRAAQADLRIVLTMDGEAPEVDFLPDDILVGAKADVFGEGVSGLTGQGVGDLVQRIREILEQRAAGAGTATRERHRQALSRAEQHLGTSLAMVDDGGEIDLVAEEIRSAIRALDSLVGRVDVENLLDEIFSSFCIGK